MQDTEAPHSNTQRSPAVWGCSGGCLGFIVGALAMAIFAVETFPMAETGAPKPSPTADAVQAESSELVEYNGFSIQLDEIQEDATTFNGELLTGSGVYMVVAFHVENIGSTPKEIERDIFRLVDDEGAEYAHDDRIAFGGQEVNPGNSLIVPNPYDVPEGVDITHVLIHDEFAESGVTPIKIAL